MRFDGGCHCRNLKVEFETQLSPDALPLRECGCTFCRRHGATAATDPEGRIKVSAIDPTQVSRYQFALRTADFLICQRCGVFVAAVCTIDGATFATLNVNVLDERSRLTGTPTRTDYTSETAEERIARRRRAWTPATVSF